MALSSHTGSFNITTGAATSTVQVTGVGFEPTLILFWWNGRTASTDAVGRATHLRGFGWAISAAIYDVPATSVAAVCSRSLDANTQAQAHSGQVKTACILEVGSGSTIVGLADIQSFDADGFTLVIDDQFVTDLRIHYLALGGSSLTNAADSSLGALVPAGTAPVNQSIALCDFQPDLVIFMGHAAGASVGSATQDSSIFIGVANGTSGEAVWAGGSNNQANTMQTLSYSKSGECIARMSGTVGGTQDRAEFVSFNSDGFTINWLERTSAGDIAWLALKGMSSVVGDLLTQTDTSTAITESSFGFKPSAALFVSAARAESSADTPTDHDHWSMGAATSASLRSAAATLDEDNTADSEVTTASEFDAVYANISTASAVQGLMDLTSFDADGMSLIMDDADPSQAFVWYLALGPADAGATEVTGTDSTRVAVSEQAHPLGLPSVSEALAVRLGDEAHPLGRPDVADSLRVALGTEEPHVTAADDRADSVAVVLDDQGHALAENPASDSVAVRLGEGSNPQGQPDVSEGAGVRAGEEPYPYGMPDVTDATAVRLSEEPHLYVTLAVLDALVTASSEVASVTVALDALDACRVGLDEASTLVVTVDASELATVNASDLADLFVRADVTDATGVGASEQAHLFATLDVAESVRVALSENAALAAVLDATESLRVALDEQSHAQVDVTPSESTAVVLDERVGALLVVVAVADALGVTASEAADILALLAASESVAVILTETGAVAVQGGDVAFIDAADTVRVILSHTEMIQAVVDAAESTRVAQDESGAVHATLAVAEALRGVVDEQSHVAVVMDAADAAAVQAGEGATLLVRVDAEEAARLGLSEVSALLVDLAVTEAVVVVTAPSVIVDGTASASDQTAVGVGDVEHVLVSLDAAGELLGVGLSEVASTIAEVLASETVTVVVAEPVADVTVVDNTPTSQGLRGSATWQTSGWIVRPTQYRIRRRW